MDEKDIYSKTGEPEKVEEPSKKSKILNFLIKNILLNAGFYSVLIALISILIFVPNYIKSSTAININIAVIVLLCVSIFMFFLNCFKKKESIKILSVVCLIFTSILSISNINNKRDLLKKK